MMAFETQPIQMRSDKHHAMLERAGLLLEICCAHRLTRGSATQNADSKPAK